MSDPKPLSVLFALVAIGVGAMILWWFHLTAGVRLGLLQAIRQVEGIPTPPPDAFLAQATWLFWGRLPVLQGLCGLAAVIALIGFGEGLATRSRDLLGGWRITQFWICTGLFGLLGVGLAAYLLSPWPLPFFWLGVSLTTVVGLMAYFFATGKPYTP